MPDLFVPIVLTEEQARAVVNGAAATFVKLGAAGLVGLDHPLMQGMLAIEEAIAKAKRASDVS